MAKKPKKKSKGKSSRKGGRFSVDFQKILGMAGGVFAKKKFLDDNLPIDDPKMKAVAIMAIGELAPKQDFVKNVIKDQSMLQGAGDALSVLALADLMTDMGIISGGAMGGDDDELAVAIEGIDDVEFDDMGDDDLDVVNEDVLGDDDLDVVNEDVLGDDDEDY